MKRLLPLPECIKHSSFWGPQTLSGGSAPVPPLGAQPPDPLRPLARSSGCATGVSVHKKCVMYVEKSSIIDRPRITYRYKNTVLSVALTRWRHSCEFIVMRPHAQSCEIERGSVRSPSALNVTLPAPAARRPRSIAISCPEGAQQQTRRQPTLLSVDGTDRRTDGRSTVT